MSTSAISSFSIQHKLDSYIRERHHDLNQLGKALESNDLAGAQQDYADIQSLGQSGPLPNGDPFLNPNREQDFEAIGSALQSGDLASARQAFEQLASSFGRAVPVPQPSPVGEPATGTSDPASGTLMSNLSVQA